MYSACPPAPLPRVEFTAERSWQVTGAIDAAALLDIV